MLRTFLCGVKFIGFIVLIIANQVTLNADDCDPIVCVLPSCRCSSTDIPAGLSKEETPQFVFLTFDDAVNTINIEFYRKAFNGRTNRDGCPAAATFFISHEYTYYDKVHELYQNGHEISLHSISHEIKQEYWREITVEHLHKEFSQQINLTSKFANIPSESMKGIRLPFLQMSGDSSFKFLQEDNFLYDCSWPTQHFVQPGLWPYTLNYRSVQDCVIGPCPTTSIPGPWVVPMIMWLDTLNYPCSMVDGCGIQPTEEDDIYKWILKNFHTTYDSNKAPWGFYMHSAWFSANLLRLNAYIRFLNYLQNLENVYIVGIQTAINWIKNPIPLSQMKTTEWSNCRKVKPLSCAAKNCEVKKGEEYRYLGVCGSCPAVFPWIGNPLGLKQ